jgi:putative glutamine amidotransferase
MQPLILISPSTQNQGAEFGDLSLSLSECYTEAILAAGGLPFILPPTTSRNTIAELVRRSDGVLLTGGDDIQTGLYQTETDPKLTATVGQTDPPRDAWELELINQTFAQRKPLLGICRGHQLLNVALGGTLIIDIPSQVPNALNHRQFDKKAEPVHDAQLTPGTLLAAIVGKDKIGVNSTHHQAIGALAKPLIAAATTSDGIIEALELKDPAQLPFLLTVQFHPERLFDRYKTFLTVFKCFIGACEAQSSKPRTL